MAQRPPLLVSVLTVTARDTSLWPLARALMSQRLPKCNLEWVIVDARYPKRKNQLAKWAKRFPGTIKYAPAPDSWARERGYRFLATARNASLLLSGDRTYRNVLCLAIDDDCLPQGKDYISSFVDAWKKREALVIPVIDYEGGPRKLFPNGNAAMAIPLEDAVELNGYDELMDANWPATPTFEDVDLAFRLKSLLYPLEPREDVVLKHVKLPAVKDAQARFNGIKCNYVLRIAGSSTTWDVNAGPPPVTISGGFAPCLYLDREQCSFLGRRCELPLELARYGHPDLEEFWATRPRFDMISRWKEWSGEREKAKISR